MAYTYRGFPKWLYHETLPPILVKTQAQQDALGPAWFEQPVAPPLPVILPGHLDTDGYLVVGALLPFKIVEETLTDGTSRVSLLAKHPTKGEITVAFTEPPGS